MKTYLLTFCILAAPALFAQEDLAFTVGTTYTDGGGQSHAYLLWQATNADRLAGRTHAIYMKAGDAASTQPFAQVGVVRLLTDPNDLDAAIVQAQNLGDDPVELANNINNLFEGMIQPDSSLTIGDKLSLVIQAAQADQEVYERLLFLARLHPGLNISLGLGFTTPITGLVTFEVRQYDPASGLDLNVTGRITLDGNSAPLSLPAPGDVVQVPRTDGEGHLNIRLRWATPDDLRRLSLLRYGYNIYRITESYALSQGYDVNPPSAGTLQTLVDSQPNDAVRANRTPIMAGIDYTNSSVVTAPADEYFFVDDNNQFYGGTPFEACTRFYYFITARDILGRDGAVSNGLAVTICDTVPPASPRQLSIENDYNYVSGSGGDQRLKVVFKQNDENSERDAASTYRIYRWTQSSEYLQYETDPNFNLIATVSHVAGEDFNSYVDNGPGAPSMPADANKTFWYTVRAEDGNNCIGCLPNLSGNSAPAFGVLRDRVGPGGPTGTVNVQCTDADVEFTEVTNIPYKDAGIPEPSQFLIPDLASQVVATDNGPGPLSITQQPPAGTPVQSGSHTITVTVTDASGNSATCQQVWQARELNDDFSRFRFSAKAAEGQLAWAEFYMDGTDPANLLGRVNFSSTDTKRWYDYIIPRSAYQNFTVYCRVQTIHGKTSTFALHANNSNATPGYIREICFTGLVTAQIAQAGDGCNTHTPVVPGSTDVIPITGTIIATADTKEWKLYRRLDDQDLSLIDLGQGDFNAGDSIDWSDDAIPIGVDRLCYFAQLFDEHGNASPLVRLGCIFAHSAADMPVPILTAIDPAGDKTDPKMTIKWFCQPEGVDRFRVLISSDSPNPPPTYDDLGLNIAPNPNLVQVEINGQLVDLHFDEYRTPRLGGSNFSDQPMFEVTLPVEAGYTYTVIIKAEDEDGRVGDPSNVMQFLCPEAGTLPPLTGPDVPWPARATPPVTSIGFQGRVVAKQLHLPNGFSGVGVRIGDFEMAGPYCLIGDRENPFFTPGTADPLTKLYFSDVSPNEPILPIALYRYQVPSAEFPDVSGHLVQVSPKLEQIAYRTGLVPNFWTYGAMLEDPFFAIQPVDPQGVPSCFGTMPDLTGDFEISDCTSGEITVTQSPEPGSLILPGTTTVTITATDAAGNTSSYQTTHTWYPPAGNDPTTYEIFALDTQPVVSGASYKYLLARFKANGELHRIIPVDAIQVSDAL